MDAGKGHKSVLIPVKLPAPPDQAYDLIFFKPELAAVGEPGHHPDLLSVLRGKGDDQFKLVHGLGSKDPAAEPVLKGVPHRCLILMDARQYILLSRQPLLLTDIHLPRRTDLKPVHNAVKESSKERVCLHRKAQPHIFGK